ncbi:hypothetical protein ABW20_dc0104581 [Dactylellina cionopaga]|nr:hypothetical protein ABW20_dc0104581 [Dactylellina cionopaga]
MQRRLLMMRNTELKEILQKCGWPVSGTKSAMVEQIQSRLPQSRLITLQRSKSGTLERAGIQPHEHRILSLDMGIKNLALCLLRLPPIGLSPEQNVVPEILAWQRFSLFDLSSSLARGDEPSSGLPSSTVRPSDMDFAAASLAPLATTLARQLVANHNPTIIAIEKQRYRTMGSAAVQEWTIRVNKLEAMLHAALRVLQEEEVWKRGSACSICPQKVTGFWLNRYGLLQGARAGAITKPLKIKLVRTWIESDQGVTFNKDNVAVAETASLFIKPPKQSKLASGEKLDDLADSLLQGLGIIEWERNRLELIGEWNRHEIG